MELCLYHPVHGYYEKDQRAIGRAGDFYTSVSVGSVFGELLAWRFAQWLRELPAPTCHLVEAGAHDGQLALDLLSFLEKRQPDVFGKLSYVIIEPSQTRRRRQRERLAGFEKNLRWAADWQEIGPRNITGVIFSNELLDAFPIEQYGWDKDGQMWFRHGVGVTNGAFTRARLPTSSPSPDAPQELLAALPDGFTIERPLAAADWWRQAAGSLDRGRLVAIDYGFAESEPFSPARPHGALRAYRDHRMSESIFDDVGNQDITAHVDFSKIIDAGAQGGLITASAPLQSQSRFLIETLAAIEGAPGSFPDWTPKRLRQFQTLTHPEHLGEKFKILVQHRE